MIGKVGVFDSGVGGITVLAELRNHFPSLDYFYLGDTAHVPYGPKSPSQIQRLSADCARIFKEQDVHLLVVACNTASSWALPVIQEVMGPVPVLGVVEPGVQAAMAAVEQIVATEVPVLVLATQATVKSHAYGKSLRKRLDCLSQTVIQQPGRQSEVLVIEQACPLLVPMIEEGWIDHSILHQTIREYVGNYSQKYSQGVALLGCTHYPWIHKAFERALPGWVVVNSAWAVAHAMKQEPMFEIFHQDSGELSRSGRIEWLYTDPEAVPQFAKQLIDFS